MTRTREFRVRLRWPGHGPGGACDNFFLGIWHPTRDVAVAYEPPADVPQVQASGRNWWMASSASPHHGRGAGLVHASERHAGGVAFRGYLLEPPLHSYSPPSNLLEYWDDRILSEHNGVFSAAVVDASGETLTLLSDVFGMGPIYHAALRGGAVLFATNPRYLVTEPQGQDWMAARCLLESGFIAADRSLSTGVSRVPAGKAIRWTDAGAEFVSWLELESLPAGARRLDAQGVRQVEDVFQRAMDRCLALSREELLLPLSSGHDSRRFLAALLARRTPFRAFTYRGYHKHRDLDARYAAEMARDFGFPHTIVEEAPAAEYAEFDWLRRLLTDAETGMHSWVPGLMCALPKRPCLLLDGIVGDILGNPGYRLPGLYESPERDIEIIAGDGVKGAFDSVTSRQAWPTAGEVRSDLARYLRGLPQRVNLAEFAFILLRQRRMTSPWSQQLVPPGHIVVCPYLDLEYVRLLLGFVPADKHATVLQRRCLAEFWPQFLRYPGTRDIPADAAQRSPHAERRATIACLRKLLAEVEEAGGMDLLKALLGRRVRLALTAARVSDAAALRAQWFLRPILEVVSRQKRQRPCWEGIDG
jgi:hypothetical protein